MLYDLPEEHLARYWISYSTRMPWNNACMRPKLQGRTGEYETIEHTSVQLLTLSFPKNGSSVIIHCYRHPGWYVLPSCIMKTELGMVKFTMEPWEREEWSFVLVNSWATRMNSLLQHFYSEDSSHGPVTHPLGPSHYFNWCSPSVHFWSMGENGPSADLFQQGRDKSKEIHLGNG